MLGDKYRRRGWLVLVILLFVAGRLVPAVRWFFRQRAERAVEAYADENGVSMAVAMARVGRYAREIVPSFNAFLYFRVGIPLAAWISTSLYDVRVDPKRGLAALDQILDEDASVVFVMNHRSNLDYILLAHVMEHRAALSYAAGEWAVVWPLGSLIGGMGAFFVR